MTTIHPYDRVELRNVKHAQFASEETDCFEAAVYIDGVKTGTVSNDGHGGCNRYEPHDLVVTLEAIALQGPRIKTDCMTKGQFLELDPDADTLIGEKLNAWLQERDFKRLIKRVVIKLPTDKPGEFRIVGTKALKPTPEVLASIARQYPTATILNAMPYADALHMYREDRQ
jgi:hypothetical protein